MKNVVLITETLMQYDNIRRGISDISSGYFKVTNNFFPVDRLIKFKRNQFLQILFPVPDILIINKDIFTGKDFLGNNENLLSRISILGVINKQTKVIAISNLTKKENKRDSSISYLKRNHSALYFASLVFTENAKTREIIDPLFQKMKEISFK